MNGKLAAHIALMLMGFAAAGFAAALPIEISELVRTPAKMADPVARISIFASGVLGILAFAFPVWILAVIFCEIGNVTRLRWYAAAGASAALFPLLLFNILADLMARNAATLLVIIGAGMAGGAAYWAIAGRKAGTWKRTSP